jgi:hypothetical protein
VRSSMAGADHAAGGDRETASTFGSRMFILSRCGKFWTRMFRIDAYR